MRLRRRAARDAVALRLIALAPPMALLFLQAPGAVWPRALAVVTAALACAFVFAEIRGRGPILEVLVPALLVMLFAPPEAASWQLALALSLAIVLGALVFGGAGFGFLSIAALALVLLAFSFPPLAPVMPSQSVIWFALPGGLLLMLAGLAPWRVVLAGAVGVVLATGPSELDPALAAPFAILLIHFAADPFGAPVTGPGQWLSGLMVGGLIVLLGAPETRGLDMSAGVFAVLLAGLFAPLVDAGVIAIADWRDGLRHG
ncbi:RnfABCDGE type electron transport complex subunit D [Limimaricola hongkongensis]|uniref:Uncharacterized protein n=2 Tax=Limimaricola hongkongensis TaxID=278132 RepID=A0A017HEQ9_9RHOB|nr:RnfABCDGE type electron transport complex subunit D [Limimaricola hongkongensis]EYD72800.1 hypothetical protein Lokhon_01605 [Limimaricola hongkongensis DSM 17492]